MPAVYLDLAVPVAVQSPIIICRQLLMPLSQCDGSEHNMKLWHRNKLCSLMALSKVN